MKNVKSLLATVLMLLAFTGFSQWTEINIGATFQMNKLSFVSDNVGYGLETSLMTFYPPIIKKTEDGGLSWDTVNTPISGQLLDLDFYKDGEGVIVFRDFSSPKTPTQIYQTLDDGLTWQNISPDSTFAGMGFAQGQFLNQNTGFLGVGEILYKTIDGGNTWTTHPLTRSVISMEFKDANHGTIGCFDGSFAYMGSIHSTSDGGQTWDTTFLPDYNSVIGEIIYTDNALFAAPVKWGAYKKLKYYKSLNNGVTWDTLYVPSHISNSELADIDFKNEQTGVILIKENSVKNHIYHTADGGASWIYQDTISKLYESDLELTSGTGYIGGAEGKLYKLNAPLSLPELERSTVKIYPNPIIGGQELHWETEREFNAIFILDNSGRKIFEQKVERSTSLNLPELSHGVYVVQFVGEHSMSSHFICIQ